MEIVKYLDIYNFEDLGVEVSYLLWDGASPWDLEV